MECHQGPATNLIGVPERTDGGEREVFEDTLFKKLYCLNEMIRRFELKNITIEIIQNKE